MQQQRELAIVLRSVPYEERNRVVTALTERHGMVSALARNAIQSRRYGGCLEPFAASEWHFVEKPGAELWRLEQAQIRRSFDGLRKDFERLSMASVFNEVVLKIAPRHEACPELFRLHSNALAALEEAPGTGAELSMLNAYLAKVLQWSGSQPQLQACLQCQKPVDEIPAHQALSCVVANAGWICPDCRSAETRHVREREMASFQHSLLRVTATALRDFHCSLSLPIRQIPAVAQASRAEHQELFRFLDALFVYHLPGFDRKALRSVRFLGLESTVPLQEARPR